MDLIDPDSQTVVIVAGRSKNTDPKEIDAEIEKGATRMAGVPHRDTWGVIGGHRALTRVGGQDSHAGRVSWIVWVQSEATRVSIAFQTDKPALNGVLRRLQPIRRSSPRARFICCVVVRGAAMWCSVARTSATPAPRRSGTPGLGFGW